MLEKPYDILVIFAIFALVVVTIGTAMGDINLLTNTTHNTSFYTTVDNRISNEDGFSAVTTDSAESIVGEEGAGDQATQEGFLLKGFNSLLKLGKSWGILEKTANEVVEEIPIDPIYITLILGLLLVSFAVVVYTYIRGFT